MIEFCWLITPLSFYQLCEFARFNTRNASGEPLVVIEPTTATILLKIEQRILGDLRKNRKRWNNDDRKIREKKINKIVLRGKKETAMLEIKK
jgi:hypothetical protein